MLDVLNSKLIAGEFCVGLVVHFCSRKPLLLCCGRYQFMILPSFGCTFYLTKINHCNRLKDHWRPACPLLPLRMVVVHLAMSSGSCYKLQMQIIELQCIVPCAL